MSLSLLSARLAEIGGVDILQKNVSQANDIRLTWDYLWQEFFAKPNVLWTTVVYLSSFIVSYCFIAFAISFVSGILTNRFDISIDNFLWLIIVMMLLSNNARPLAEINLFIRDFTYSHVENMYNYNLIGVKINEVITDVLVSGDAQVEISNLFARCNGVGGTDQLECLLEVEQKAQDIIEEIENRYTVLGFDLKGIARLKERLNRLSFKDKLNLFNPSLLRTKEIVNPFNMPLFLIVIRSLLKNIQWLVLNGIELALLLTCFYAPIACSLSLVPLGTRALTLWFFGVLALVSLIFSYSFCVGIIAMAISISQTQLQSEIGFLMFLAIGSPLIAWGFSKGGGASLLQAITMTSLMITRASYSIMSGILNLVL